MSKSVSWIAIALTAGTLFGAACGDDDSAEDTLSPITTSQATTSAGGSSATSTTVFNDSDVAFAQGMIAHHQQAVEMAEIALDPNIGASAEVVDLATRIRAAQDPEITLMTGWLEAWGQTLQMDTTDGHDMSSMEGMMSAEEMDELAAATGTAFDEMWMAMMIRHHEGAIAQSEEAKIGGSNTDVLALADQVIAAQSQEIAEMQALLAG